ncbi:hypothetical protein BofuT4_P156790.1 [Botrytis cinerea T4]|uniref:Uncharacterized protein n=1 Tax=Botryotinia fuckeliana (strain T4) TaxID=999810 RepID=G2YUI5_BOTF4|nr:hypothetical protein BofuT4_P156790.1 [Botrytis cinerea T4]
MATHSTDGVLAPVCSGGLREAASLRTCSIILRDRFKQ